MCLHLISQDSGHTFCFDGDLFKAGDWKKGDQLSVDKEAIINAKSSAKFEFLDLGRKTLEVGCPSHPDCIVIKIQGGDIQTHVKWTYL